MKPGRTFCTLYAGCLHIPEAVPQQGGTHQAEEKILLMTSGGKRVTFLCTCSKLSTRARKTPTENSMAPRITRLVVLQQNTTSQETSSKLTQHGGRNTKP